MVDVPPVRYERNGEGVHAMFGEHTLCGDAYDIAETEADFRHGPMETVSRGPVTCPRCVAVILFCRQLRVSVP